MQNLITTSSIPVYRVLSTSTVDNFDECCPVTSACFPDGTVLPRTLYIQFYDQSSNYAWSAGGCPANNCRSYWSFSRALTWDGVSAWEFTDGDVVDTGDASGCAVDVSLNIDTVGPVEDDSRNCFLSLTGTMRSGSHTDPIDDAGDPGGGATLNLTESTFDPLYLVFEANNDTCAGVYIITS